MKKVLMITEMGYDDSEVFYPYFRLIEENIEVFVASKEKGEVQGKYHFSIQSDITFREVVLSMYDALLLPGGKAPEKLRLIDDVLHITQAFVQEKKPVAAICHGQQILISANVLDGVTATCYPGIKDDLKNAGANYEDKNVVVFENFVTSRRPEDLPYFMKEFIHLVKSGGKE